MGMQSTENCWNCHEDFDSCDCGEAETYSTVKPHCPHCGNVVSDEGDPNPDYYIDGDFEMDCPSCGKDFEVSVYVSHSYTCTRKED